MEIKTYTTENKKQLESLFKEVVSIVYGEDTIAQQKKFDGENPYLSKVFACFSNNNAVAFAALYENDLLQRDGKKIVCIGSYECINDPNVSALLLQSIYNDPILKKYQLCVGPMNGSTWENYRFGRNYDTEPFFLEPYNAEHYCDQFESFGFKHLAHYISSIDRIVDIKMDNYDLFIQRFASLNLTFRNIDLENYDTELDKLYELCSLSFASNFLYTPIEKEQFKKKYALLKPFLKSENILLAEDNGALVGIIFCFENLYNPKQIIVKTLARHPDKKYNGLGNLLSFEYGKTVAHRGYDTLIHALMIDTNKSVKISEKYMGTPFREYLLFVKEITN